MCFHLPISCMILLRGVSCIWASPRMFLLFEVACGMFFPTYGTLRSKYIPEETRAAVMNLYRIPLNAFVILVLIKVKNLPVETVFTICACAHAFSFVAYTLFLQKIK